jgi:hypothetical protein
MTVNSNQLQILGAAYGRSNVERVVSKAVNWQAIPNTLSIRADNPTFGDSWVGVPKTLTVVFRYGSDGAALTKVVREGEVLTLGQADYDASRAGASSATSKHGNLTVWGASYGPADVTNVVRSRIGGDQNLHFTADNQTFGDSWPGVPKTCVVVSSYGGSPATTEITQETQTASVEPANELQILGAAYGLADVGAKVRSLVNTSARPQTLDIGANNQTFGDPWPGVPKTLSVVFRYGSDGAPAVKTAREGGSISIGAADATASRAKASAQTAVPGMLTVWGASYGPEDVTGKVSGRIGSDQVLRVSADNASFGDSWVGVPKSFVLVSSFGAGPPAVQILQEGAAAIVAPPGWQPPAEVVS